MVGGAAVSSNGLSENLTDYSSVTPRRAGLVVDAAIYRVARVLEDVYDEPLDEESPRTESFKLASKMRLVRYLSAKAVSLAEAQGPNSYA